MLIVRDILDKQILDRNDEKIGKVDSVVLELNRNRLRIDHLESNGVVAANRVHPRLVKLALAVRRWWGEGKPSSLRVPWAEVREINVTVKVDRDAPNSPSLDWEHWLQTHIVHHIPGSDK